MGVVMLSVPKTWLVRELRGPPYSGGVAFG
jgi:hypothetical protein